MDPLPQLCCRVVVRSFVVVDFRSERNAGGVFAAPVAPQDADMGREFFNMLKKVCLVGVHKDLIDVPDTLEHNASLIKREHGWVLLFPAVRGFGDRRVHLKCCNKVVAMLTSVLEHKHVPCMEKVECTADESGFHTMSLG